MPGFDTQQGAMVNAYANGYAIPGRCGSPTVSRSSQGSDTDTVAVTSVAPTAEALRLYPNPAQGNFTVQMPLPEQHISSVSLYTPSGQCVWQQHFDAPENTAIVQPALPAGMYWLRACATSGQMFHSKITLQ
jgi:hypothetical protein